MTLPQKPMEIVRDDLKFISSGAGCRHHQCGLVASKTLLALDSLQKQIEECEAVKQLAEQRGYSLKSASEKIEFLCERIEVFERLEIEVIKWYHETDGYDSQQLSNFLDSYLSKGGQVE